MDRRKEMIARMLFIMLLFPIIIASLGCRHKQSSMPARNEINNEGLAYINKIPDQQIIEAGVKKANELPATLLSERVKMKNFIAVVDLNANRDNQNIK